MKASGKASSQGTGAFKQVFVDSSQALGARSQALGALYCLAVHAMTFKVNFERLFFHSHRS